MQLAALIDRLHEMADEHGNVEVKLDIEGQDMDPDITWFEATDTLYLW
jgi:uncharacterized protein YkuJ